MGTDTLERLKEQLKVRRSFEKHDRFLRRRQIRQ